VNQLCQSTVQRLPTLPSPVTSLLGGSANSNTLETATVFSKMTSSQKPSSPPPAYVEVDPSQQHASSSRPQPPPQSASYPADPSSLHHTAGYYGPTPILAQQQTHILPYYDPRSPYSVTEATSRARWRFLGALFWALLILSVTSAICGMEVEIQRHPWRGWWVIFGGNNDPWMDQ
jgi:hypothetical protein